WQPDLSVPPGQWDPAGGHGGPTDPSANSAPWVSFNNPIGMQYVPGPGFNIGVGTALTYTNPDATDRYNGDNYQSSTDHTQDQASSPAGDTRLRPTVPTVGALWNNAIGPPVLARQALFGDHGHTTPVSAPELGLPDVGRMILYDRSNIGLAGGNQQL